MMRNALVYGLVCLAALWLTLAAEAGQNPARPRRILYNLDGDSCLTLKAGRNGPGPMTTNDLRAMVAELTRPGSQVDTLLVCVNAQVMYYPTTVGTWRGALSTDEERARWSAHERQRLTNVQAFFAAGVDPYGLMFAEDRKSTRLNSSH